MINSLGAVLDVSEKAEKLINEIQVEMLEFQNYISKFPSKKVAYLIWKNPFMAVGNRTFIQDLLRLNNFENIVAKKTSRYPEVDVKQLKKAELILLSSEPFPFKEEDAIELKKALHSEVLLVDGEYFSWYGSRLKDAFTYFKTLH